MYLTRRDFPVVVLSSKLQDERCIRNDVLSRIKSAFRCYWIYFMLVPIAVLSQLTNGTDTDDRWQTTDDIRTDAHRCHIMTAVIRWIDRLSYFHYLTPHNTGNWIFAIRQLLKSFIQLWMVSFSAWPDEPSRPYTWTNKTADIMQKDLSMSYSVNDVK